MKARKRAKGAATPLEFEEVSSSRSGYVGLGMLAGVFAVALVMRLAHIWQISGTPFFQVLISDGLSYDTWARAIARGEWWGKEVFYQAPLYPYFLALVYSLLDGSLLTARICQAVLSASACVLLAAAGRRLLSPKVGLLAGLGLALYPPAVYMDTLIQKSVLDVFLLTLLIYLLVRSCTEERKRYWLSAGAVSGLFILTRENAWVIPAVLLIWLFAFNRTRIRAQLSPALMLVLGLLIVLLPVGLRNRIVGGEFHLTTSQFGPNFYIGNNAEADGSYQPLVAGHGDPRYERADATRLAEQATGRTLSPGEVSAYWAGRAFEFIVQEPLSWLRLVGRKFALCWNWLEVADSEDQYSAAEYSWPLRIFGQLLHFGTIVPLAAIGVVVTRRTGPKFWLLALLLVAYALSILVFYVFARYRYPLVPVLLLFAAAGAGEVIRLIQERAHARLAVVLAALVPVAVFCNWPMASRNAIKAATFSNFAGALHARGQLDQAAQLCRRAVELDPSMPEGLYTMGNIAAANGDLAAAASWYQKAIEQSPEHVESHTNLGLALMFQGRPDQAEHHLQLAMRLDPGYYQAVNNYGTLLLQRGRVEEAVPWFRKALEMCPDYVDAHRNLANCFARQGLHDQQIEQYRLLVDLRPDQPELLLELGKLLAVRNRAEEAAVQIEKFLAIRPDQPEAHLQLGITMLNAGKPIQAMGSLREAIRVSSEDPVMLSRVAFLIASRPESGPQELAEAIAFAERANAKLPRPDPRHLHVLAKAYAAAGRFEPAVAAAQKALGLASQLCSGELAAQLKSDLENFQQSRLQAGASASPQKDLPDRPAVP